MRTRILATTLGLAVLGLAACSNATPTPAASTSTPVQRTVTYYLTGSAGQADVTVLTETGEDKAPGIRLPMRNQVTKVEGLTVPMAAGSPLRIEAHIGADGGTIGCEIKVDGVTVASQSKTGAWTKAVCTGTA